MSGDLNGKKETLIEAQEECSKQKKELTEPPKLLNKTTSMRPQVLKGVWDPNHGRACLWAFVKVLRKKEAMEGGEGSR